MKKSHVDKIRFYVSNKHLFDPNNNDSPTLKYDKQKNTASITYRQREFIIDTDWNPPIDIQCMFVELKDAVESGDIKQLEVALQKLKFVTKNKKRIYLKE